MTEQTSAIQFTSLATEQEILGICAVHDVPFSAIEELVFENWVLVAPGALAQTKIDICQKRLMENPSPRLETAIHGYLRGFTFAREKMGKGKRVPREQLPATTPFRERLRLERKLRKLGADEFLVASPDRDLDNLS